MSHEKYTRYKPSLPEADYTVIARLRSFAGPDYTAAQASALQETLYLQPREVQRDDGALFVRLHVGLAKDEQVWLFAADFLHRGLVTLDLDPEVSAGVNTTKNLSTSQDLVTPFLDLCEDISLDLIEELNALNGLPVPTFDFDSELRDLAKQ